MSLIIKGMKLPQSCNPRHYKDYKFPTIIEAEVSEE